jgi:hypothetical protein
MTKQKNKNKKQKTNSKFEIQNSVQTAGDKLKSGDVNISGLLLSGMRAG